MAETIDKAAVSAMSKKRKRRRRKMAEANPMARVRRLPASAAASAAKGG